VMNTLHMRATRLVEGMKEMAAKHGIALQIDSRGSMFGFFFNEKPVLNFADALTSDKALFAKFHAGMLDEGYYFACSQFETGFISTATTDSMIEDTIAACDRVFGRIK
jgi:glutamate-1-semialdehyde 2,1-aminomutase